MTFAWFLSFEGPGVLPESGRAALRTLVRSIDCLERAILFTPETARDRFSNDGASPPLSLQLDFAELPDLEAAVAADGPLAGLKGAAWLGDLAEADASQQAFYVRTFPVDDAVARPADGGLPCSYVVHYPGPAADLNAWLSHYITHHPPIMRRFPGIRAIEILSRVDWCGGLPWSRADHMQRNRVMFDSAEALTAALHSPVRDEMRADFTDFPAYEGGNFHYPMATEIIPGLSEPAARA
jgi:uncharacterized protein (TIGR02118 family)